MPLARPSLAALTLLPLLASALALAQSPAVPDASHAAHVAPAAPAAPATATATADAIATARDTIWEKEQKIYQGRAAAGLTYYLQNTSDRYVGWPPGLVKPSNLDALRKGAAGMNRKNAEKLEMSFTDFTLQDGTAVIYYQTHRTVLPDGKPVDERFDVIHVWVREGAEWKLIGAMARTRT